MVISIDHGNKQIKTVHKVFVSGLVESDVRPALGEEYILYNDRYYSLTGHRLAYRRDKSKDESFFLLTLFGVAYEILATGEYTPGQTTTVDLLIGLPPAHYGAQYHDFETYFNRGVVKFSLGSKPFSVYFNSVRAGSQTPCPFSLTRKPQAMLVDEKSTSVETVKKEPPFATIEAGNANRTKAKGGSSIWTKKVYHIRVGIANIT